MRKTLGILAEAFCIESGLCFPTDSMSRQPDAQGQKGKWRRPETVPGSTVWRRFEGNKPFPNGKYPKFRIQDCTEALVEDVLEHMKECYLRDEPLCRNLDIVSDPLAVREQLQAWREFSEYGMVLICILENKEELDNETLPTLVGCNLTGVLLSDRPVVEFEPKSPLLRRTFDLMNFLHQQLDVFKHYGVEECLYALGLSVHPLYRGQKVGLEIMKARFDLGRAVGLKVTVTVFSNIASQIIARQAGFETLYEIEYEHYKVNGEIVFKGMTTKAAKLMGARIT